MQHKRHRLKIFIIPSKHLELRAQDAPFCCSSKHKQVSQLDVSVRGPVSLTQGCGNDLREDSHFHHSQFRVPGYILYHASDGIFAALAYTQPHYTQPHFMGLGVRISSITACFCFLLAAASSFSRMTSPSARCAFFKIALRSSSFLLIAIHDCIPALVWNNTS